MSLFSGFLLVEGRRSQGTSPPNQLNQFIIHVISPHQTSYKTTSALVFRTSVSLEVVSLALRRKTGTLCSAKAIELISKELLSMNILSSIQNPHLHTIPKTTTNAQTPSPESQAFTVQDHFLKTLHSAESSFSELGFDSGNQPKLDQQIICLTELDNSIKTKRIKIYKSNFLMRLMDWLQGQPLKKEGLQKCFTFLQCGCKKLGFCSGDGFTGIRLTQIYACAHIYIGASLVARQ